MTQIGFDRDQLLEALTELVHRLSAQHVETRICIIGGAALSIDYYDRRSTADVDALISPPDEVLAAARQMAHERGWPEDWLNPNATGFLPPAGPREWKPVIQEAGVELCVAPPEMLLALKLNAGRPGKDLDDIGHLVEVCAVTSLEDAVELFEVYYPGEVMNDRARAHLRDRFD